MGLGFCCCGGGDPNNWNNGGLCSDACIGGLPDYTLTIPGPWTNYDEGDYEFGTDCSNSTQICQSCSAIAGDYLMTEWNADGTSGFGIGCRSTYTFPANSCFSQLLLYVLRARLVSEPEGTFSRVSFVARLVIGQPTWPWCSVVAPAPGSITLIWSKTIIGFPVACNAVHLLSFGVPPGATFSSSSKYIVCDGPGANATNIQLTLTPL